MIDMSNNVVFVFGANLAGIHNKGSALHAKQHYGAQQGVGVGRTGMAYAIPTKDYKFRVLELTYIRRYIHQFITYAKMNPNLTFRIVKIGCGLAGYNENQIKPSFKGCPSNCILPEGWRD